MREVRSKKSEIRSKKLEVRNRKKSCILHLASCFLSLASRLLPLFLLLTAVIGCSHDTATPAYEKAEDLFAQRSYVKAIASYNTIVTKYPESQYASASQYKIGLIYNLYLKDVRRAMNAYAALMLLYPNSKEIVMARQDIAEIYVKSGDYRKAIGEYQWLIKNTGGARSNNFQYQIAMAYLKLTDIKQARIELQEIIKNPPSSELGPKVYYEIANTYYLEGNYKEAIKAYEMVVSLYPNSQYAYEAQLGKAVCIEETGNLAEAITLYKELEKSYPNPGVIKIRLDAIEAREKKNIPVALKEN
ncbi:MAG: tetratricopeptide repeat protein [Deltaproteobacteria bacterium]|nr:tetratricopeptide repeat protein [Deltaproteobacteria bacterium]